MKALNVRISEHLYTQIKKLAKTENKTLKKVTVEALIQHLGGREFLDNVDAKEIYKFIILEYIKRTEVMLKDFEEETETFDLKYLQLIQKKYFESKIEVYKNIIETLEKGDAPKSITEIVDFSSDDDFSLIGKISATKEIKYELDKLLDALMI